MHKKSLPLSLILLCVILWLTGCGKVKQATQQDTAQSGLEDRNTTISRQLVYEGSMERIYAEQFAVDYYQDGYALITVADGGRYLLVPEGSESPQDVDADIVVLKQPLDHIYLVASAVMDMVCELDALETIRFSGQKAEGWCREEAREQMEQGSILYAGKYSMPDYELIVSGGCSLAIENNMISHSPEVMEKLESFEIPVMIDFSSYESHPLGRVEWVKLYGVLFDKEEEAERLFEEQRAILERVAEEAASGKTVAFFYITTNGMVNVRSSSDYVPKMIELAGGRYIFDELGDGKRSSVSLQMEEFYKTAKDADYLIYNSTIDGEIESIDELLEKESMLKDFKAVKEGNVWCTTRDLYQQPMSAGGMIEDLHNMLSGDDRNSGMRYLFLLQ
ncbi:MAG: ABC transporter substrate-binding protein [Lachnospiraceae bacterium]|nr:ABC transporter substrate-binding protein [Lachnospiraceae bacterium]